MTQLIFKAMPTEIARSYQSGAADANGQQPERFISSGDGVPCRHCLQQVPEGEPYLVLSYRPFPDLQPYAEAGPIFLCANECRRHPESEQIPPMLKGKEALIIRGYNAENRIIYGTGKVVPAEQIPFFARNTFENEAVKYIHIRSSTNNCFQCRVEQLPPSE
ncbi:MAG: DUF1203 domain-containing protein [Chloroflexota bacterium]